MSATAPVLDPALPLPDPGSGHYGRFRVPEVWIWQETGLRVHGFDPETARYTERSASALLPGIDLSAVARCARIEESSAAIRAFRSSLE